jgi:hypothetical protein
MQVLEREYTCPMHPDMHQPGPGNALDALPHSGNLHVRVAIRDSNASSQLLTMARAFRDRCRKRSSILSRATNRKETALVFGS